MSVNNDGPFLTADNNHGSASDDQGHMGYQGAMDYLIPPNLNGSQTTPAAAINGIHHPDNSYEGQLSEPGSFPCGQNTGLESNPFAHHQSFERFQNQSPTLVNNTSNGPHHAANDFNQNFQPWQNRGPSFPPLTDMAMRPRTAREVLPPRLSESDMRADFNSFGTGNGDMTSYSRQAAESMQAVGIRRFGASNMAQEGGMGVGFRRSPPSILAPIQYDSHNGFASGQHPGMQSSNSANMRSNMGHPGNIFHRQAEVEGWTQGQIHKPGDAASSGNEYGQSSVVANDGADTPNASDASEISNSSVSSPSRQESLTIEGSSAVQRMESLGGSGRATHSDRRGHRGEPMSSRQFRGHFDRVSNRLGGTQQKVGKSPRLKTKGATDPVNIEIVNWYDNYGMSFSDIARHINARQEARGKPGTFTPNSIHNRYNRCAPIIYQADGRVFVAIKDRKKHTSEELDAMGCGSHPIRWTPQKDQLLKRAVEDYEAKKWTRIAALFTEATNETVSARTVATRFGLL